MKSKILRLSVLILFSTIIINGCTNSNPEGNPELIQKLKEDFKKEDAKSYDKKDFSMLLKNLEKYTSEYPDNQEGHYYLGYVYDRLGMPDGSKFFETNIPLELKASDEFTKVIEINPDYKGEYYILSPYSKISSLWATIALKYLHENKSDSATWAFKKGKQLKGFSAEVLEHNKAVLSCCEKNAILFTNGDMDTFPFWYLQLVENYRRDITIVNTSLLNTPWYIIQLKNHYLFGYNNININFSDDTIKTLVPILWEPKLVSIPVPENILLKYDVKDSTMLKTGMMTWTMPNSIESNNKKGVRIQDILMKEIIESNNWERPIYFVMSADENYIGLSHYMRYSGLVFQLTPKKHKENSYDFDDQITNLCFCTNYDATKLHSGIKWEVINRIANTNDREVLYIPELYRYIMMCYSYYLEPIDKNQSTYVFKRMDEKLPVDVFVPGKESYLNIKGYYERLNQTKEIEQLNKKIEKAILDRVNNDEFYYRDYHSYKTLLQIYDDAKEYKKGIELLDKIMPVYPQDKYLSEQLQKFKLQGDK